MNFEPINKKIYILISILSLFLCLCVFVYTQWNSHSKFIFCDVGQGDGIYVRIYNKVDVVIDAGANDQIVSCIGKHMPFYDKTIELAILTHPQKDHMYGFIPLLQRYKIKHFYLPRIYSDTQTYNQLLTLLYEKKVSITFPVKGEKYTANKALLAFYWPDIQFIEANTNIRPLTSKNRSSNYFPLSSTLLDPNDFSYIFSLAIGKVDVLFTGDATPLILNRTAETADFKAYIRQNKVDILKVPHHGSKNGLTSYFLELADPTLAVISSGRNNKYGHPSSEVLKMLESKNIRSFRTDVEGDIVIYAHEDKIWLR